MVPHTRLSGWLLTGILVLTSALTARADDAPAGPARSLFQQVFPQPTGRNGYEELVVACDHLKASKLFAQLGEGQATLAQQRQVLGERHVIDSLRMLRAALAKPISSPRIVSDYRTVFPELPELRSLAKLLGMEQTVLLADGRTAEAVASFRRGLQLSRVIQFDMVVQGMVGLTIEAVQAKSIGEHLDQLSARDCEQLFQVCVSELRQPDPSSGLLEGERRVASTSVVSMTAEVRKKGPAALGELLGISDEQVKAITPIVQGILANPQALDSITAQIQQRLDQYYTRALEEARKPAWQRADVDAEFPRDNSPVGFAVSTLMPSMSRVLESFTLREAYLRLIACHCAIHRYEWEYGALPASLDELKLGEIAIDPMVGQPFEYAVHIRRYSLTGAGRRTNADDPRAVNGRTPLAIGRDD